MAWTDNRQKLAIKTDKARSANDNKMLYDIYVCHHIRMKTRNPTILFMQIL